MGATQRDGIALDRIKLLTEIEGSDLCFSVVYPSFEGTLETFKLSIDFSMLDSKDLNLFIYILLLLHSKEPFQVPVIDAIVD